MTGWIAFVWVLLVLLVGLNGFAAGVVAVLHIWSSATPRRTRIVSAGAATALLTASPLLALALGGEVTGEPLVLVVLVGLFSVLAAAASLPGALIVARKLEGPVDVVRAFE